MRDGVKTCRLTAHPIGDLTKYPERGLPRGAAMSKARRDLDWKTQFKPALFPDDVWAKRAASALSDEHTCTMCGALCANRGADQARGHMLAGSAKA